MLPCSYNILHSYQFCSFQYNFFCQILHYLEKSTFIPFCIGWFQWFVVLFSCSCRQKQMIVLVRCCNSLVGFRNWLSWLCQILVVGCVGQMSWLVGLDGFSSWWYWMDVMAGWIRWFQLLVVLDGCHGWLEQVVLVVGCIGWLLDCLY